MAGIAHVLNIAKGALLTHQLSLQVAAHNVANADTPGYTRQVLSLNTNLATPTPVGSLGGGVRGEMITRQYDQFMTHRIMKQQSSLGNLQAQQESLRVVETIFNEAPGLMLNDLFSQFWASWQELADNPELLAARQSVVQTGHLLYEQFQTMNSEITRARYDIGMSLDTAVSDVNSLTRRIAQLNIDITSSEGQHRKANDLRDRRDELVKELSQLIDVTYFESSAGAYSVLLSDGRSLVDAAESWRVEWSNNALYWIGTGKDGRETRSELGAGAQLGGKIGGWLEIRGELLENNPDNFMGRLDALANALIREINQQHTQGVGTKLFAKELTGAEAAANTAALTTTVSRSSAATTIAAGVLQINGRPVGKIEGGVATHGLAMTKAANAVQAINEAITGVKARLTTLVAGNAVTGLAAGDTVSLTVNGIQVTYTAPAVQTPAETATALAGAVQDAINTHNLDPEKEPKIWITAKAGDGANGGPANSLVLHNTMGGDESRIIIGDLAVTDSLGNAKANSTGLTEGTYVAGAGSNTGEITLFSDQPFTVKAGTDDGFLEQLGMIGSKLPPDDLPNDGRFTFSYEHGGVEASLMGFKYADELQTDGGSFDIWLYEADGSLSLSQPVTVSLERVRTLQDAANAINYAIREAGGQTTWLQASVAQNRLVLRPGTGHQFAFANDNSNFLQAAGLNTFFTGHSAGTLKVNEAVAGNLEYLAAGKVGQKGEIYRGDNSNALLITNIQGNANVRFTGGSRATLDGFYNSLVGEIGTRGRGISRSYEFTSLVTQQMNELRDATSGVSLDEEMANLIKFQHAYSAAAKLITISDEMLQSLLATVGR